jgi:undecaprenyl-phosphate 4-deoxy-4-formamido-L-arabinose transferase
MLEAARGTTPSGWASVMTIILLLSGVQFLILGVMGEYVGRAFLSANGKPQGVVREAIGPAAAVVGATAEDAAADAAVRAGPTARLGGAMVAELAGDGPPPRRAGARP